MQLVDDVQEVQMPREHGWRKRQMSGTYFRNTETYMEVLILRVHAYMDVSSRATQEAKAEDAQEQ